MTCVVNETLHLALFEETTAEQLISEEIEAALELISKSQHWLEETLGELVALRQELRLDQPSLQQWLPEQWAFQEKGFEVQV